MYVSVTHPPHRCCISGSTSWLYHGLNTKIDTKKGDKKRRQTSSLCYVKHTVFSKTHCCIMHDHWDKPNEAAMCSHTHVDTTANVHTCHGVWNYSDKEPLISHLHAHVRVLHGHNHFLHLWGEHTHSGTHTTAGACTYTHIRKSVKIHKNESEIGGVGNQCRY